MMKNEEFIQEVEDKKDSKAKKVIDIMKGKNPIKINPDMKEVSIAKKAADDVFLMAMKDADPKVASWKIYAAYYAVRLFGRWSIIPREGDNENG